MDKTIACDYCDGKFSTRNSMRSHKSRFHRNEGQHTSSNPFDKPTKGEVARAKLWLKSKAKGSSSVTSELPNIESNSDSESSNETSENKTSSDALKQFETDVESSEEESCNESGDESDDERSDKSVNPLSKSLKRRRFENSGIKKLTRKHTTKKKKIIQPVLMDESCGSSESSESDGELPDDDYKVVTEEKLNEDEQFAELAQECICNGLGKQEVGSINCFLLKYYLCLLENNKLEQRKILKDASLEFYESLQILFNCVTNGKIRLEKDHQTVLKNRKPLIKFVRKYRYVKPTALKKHLLDKGGKVSRILKLTLPILSPCL